MRKTFNRLTHLKAAKAAVCLSIFVLTYTAPFTAQEKAAPALDVREQAWSVLMEGLRDPRASHRAVAVQSLSLMPNIRRATQLTTRALDDKDFHVRTAAAMGQAQLDRLKDPKQMMQLGFQEGVGFVPFGGMGYEAFREITHGSGSAVRAAAARFLASDPDQISEDALVQAAVADNNEGVRLASLDALAQRGDPRVIGRLAKNLDEDKSAVRYRTAAVILHLSSLEQRKKK